MVRTIGWCLLTFLVLAIISVIALPAADRDQLMVALGKRSLQHSNAGLGYDDGRLVWRDTEPLRITVEQLPSLEGRRLGSSWNSGLLQVRMSWFGVSLREAISKCLELPMDRVLGDDSLDGFWFDIDAARPKSLFESGIHDWGPVRARVLEGLCEHYGISVAVQTETMDMEVLRAGPGWAAQLTDGGPGLMVQRDGMLSVQGMPVASLVGVLKKSLGVRDAEGLDLAATCSVEITWDDTDPGDLARVLADELDLHVDQVQREVPVARVSGSARTPKHLQ